MLHTEKKPGEMRDSSILNSTRQSRVEMTGRGFPAPVVYADLSFDAFIFECDRQVAENFLPSRHYPLIRLPFGKCLTALFCFEYRRTDIGPYNEMALCIPLAGHGEHILPDWLFSILDLHLRTVHVHVVHLPANTERALKDGLNFFGSPKFLAGIHFENKNKRHSCELWQANEEFLSLRISRGRRRGIQSGRQEMTFCAYPEKSGQTLRTTFQLQCDDMHIDFLPRHVILETGDGEMAEAASLLLKTPLLSVYSNHARGILHKRQVIPAA